VDEKYSLLNIRAIVTEGTLAPASSYYPYPLFNVPPATLVAGSQALYRWSGEPHFEAVGPDGFGEAAFLLTRLVQALYGALALVLTFLTGRKLFSAEAGLIGALALAFMPWHIHASGYFKPDAQLVAMVLLAFYWSVKGVESPSLKSYLLAGLGIALAMSTKMTGGLIAIPLVIGTFATGWRDKRRVGLLVLAGVVSAGFFVLFNPYWRYYLVWLSGLEKDYAMRAARQGMMRWQIPGRVVELITDPYTLGPWLGVVGLAAFLFLAARSIRFPIKSTREQAKMWMFLFFPLVYTAAYAWKTPYFKGNNFLPVIPFFCLATGWALVEIWRRAEGFWPPLSRNRLRIVPAALLLTVLMMPGLLYTYRATTPSTMDQALNYLGRKMRPSTGRLILVEKMPASRTVWEGRRRLGRGRSRIEFVDDWQAISERRLDLTDGTVFESGDLVMGKNEELRSSTTRSFESRWFRQRGPSLVAVHHDWRRVGRPVPLPIRKCHRVVRCLAADLPPEPGGAEWITLVVDLGFARGESVEEVVTIEVGDREVPLLLASRTERRAIFVTEKFAPPEGAETVVFVARKELLRRRQFSIELHRWKRSGKRG
jgi:hypothetical protein